MSNISTKAINWNAIEDPIDLDTWNRLTKNFWLDTKIPLSNDLKSFAGLNDAEKNAVLKVFANLTQLDTIQGHIGADAIAEHALTPHEVAVMRQIGFMEEVHAKSYSSIFSTLFSTEDIDEVFEWLETSSNMAAKKRLFNQAYVSQDVEGYSAFVRGVSVLLESFLFYTGFYLPLHLASTSRLTNTADIIRLIMRDEGVHGFYIGYKFQREIEKLPPKVAEKVQARILDLAMFLYVNEQEFVKEIYSPLGYEEEVKTFLRYNLNKAMQNLGMENVFPSAMTQVEPRILTQLTIDSEETHDFFSGSGSSYVVGIAEDTLDDDWG